MGERAIRLLLERIQGRTEPTHFSVEPTLKVRGSTRPAPSGTDPLTPTSTTPTGTVEQAGHRRTPATPGTTTKGHGCPCNSPPPRPPTHGARVVSLRSQYPEELLGVPRTGLRLTWRASAASAQLGYQVRWNGADTGVADPVASDDSIGVAAPGPALAAR